MAREWETPPVKVLDVNDYWYKVTGARAAEIAARRFNPNAFVDYDLRHGEARMFTSTELRYLKEIINRKNSYRG